MHACCADAAWPAACPPPPPPHPPPTTTPLLQKARKVYLLLHKERDAEWRFLKG